MQHVLRERQVTNCGPIDYRGLNRGHVAANTNSRKRRSDAGGQGTVALDEVKCALLALQEPERRGPVIVLHVPDEVRHAA